MSSKNKKIDYSLKHRWEFNIGIAVFAVILVYIIVCLYLSSKSESIKGYQVKEGSLSDNRTYVGIALREEHRVTSDNSGYINYFVREGDRASYNNLIYCIDETGKLSELIGKSPIEDNTLSEAELTSLRQDIQLFSKTFDEELFDDSTVFRSKILNNLSLIENRRIIEDLSIITASESNDIIDYVRAKDPGIVVFSDDKFCNLIASDLNASDFSEEAISEYSPVTVCNDTLIEKDGFVYKYINNENWSIVIMVPSEDLSYITSEDYVEVKFLKTGETSWAKVSYVNSFEGNSFVELCFTNSMVTFCKDRYVDIELLLDRDYGLKVPNSSIAEKEFYLIDKDFVMHNDDTNEYYVFRKEYGENGETITTPKVDIYKEDDDVYYVDTFSLDYGNILLNESVPITTDNEGSFIVSKVGTLIGVYNINKGYAEFNRVEILYSNDEYSLVNPYSQYGLRAYDYIALDASCVTNKDFVY